MKQGKRKEPTVVLLVFLALQIGLIMLFALRGSFRTLEEHFDWKQLALVGGVLFIIYILYVELRAKRMGQTLVEEKIKTHTLVDALPLPVVVADEWNRVVSANDAACRLLGVDSVSSIGTEVAGLFDGTTSAKIAAGGAGKIEGASSGKTPLLVTVAPLPGEAGRLLLLEEPSAERVEKDSAPDEGSFLASALWDSLSSMDVILDSLEENVRRTLVSAMIRSRKLLGDPAAIDALPEKAEKKQADVGTLVRDAAARMAPIARGRKIDLQVDVKEACTAGVDEAMLGRAVEAILLNACTYGPEGGTVKAEVEGGEQEVLLRVTDAGVGIPREEFSEIFEAGFVGSQQVPEGEGGRGLGLALARRVVELHGGSVWVESETGRGTRVSLNVPRG